MPSDGNWWVYIIETKKGQLYTGITTDVDRRWTEHCAVSDGIKNAKGAKFFRSQTPKNILLKESYQNRSEASKRESAIKKMTHQDKRALCGLV